MFAANSPTTALLIIALLYSLWSTASAAPPKVGIAKKVVDKALWKQHRLAIELSGKIITVDQKQQLWSTDPKTGNRIAVGKPLAGVLRALFVVDRQLFGITKKGFLWAIDKKSAVVKQIGRAGAMKAVLNATGYKKNIYTIERDGKLYITDPATGRYKVIGNPGWNKTRFLLPAGDWLYTIENIGALYRVHPRDGRWRRVGRFGSFQHTAVMISMFNNLYSVEAHGALIVTDPLSGKRRALAKDPFYGLVRMLIGVDGVLYAIDRQGYLYRIRVI